MFKYKKQDSTDSHSCPEDGNPPSKKSKKNSQKPTCNNDDTEESWEIGKNRFIKLRKFKGKYYVDIREFYSADDGELRPSKKGIFLTLEQWNTVQSCATEIDDAIKRIV